MGKKVVHVEFPAQDADRAEKFWEGIGGWSIEDAGMQGPIIYLGSDDIDADLAKVRELGGEAEDKEPIPHVGWFARCKDTEGNPFSLFQSDESVTMPT